ncbi:hypothetical protein ACOSQ2_006119 [Xanthoceras sorbifolium]
MGFWCRIYQSKLRHLNHQLKTFYLQAPSLNYTTAHPRTCFVENPFASVFKRPTHFCNNVRFFAAPVQYQTKKDDTDTNGPRLNDQIPAQFVRLVTEEGHRIVSRREALELAGKLKLDLVEVQKDGDPPVCKIMDFHKEQYRKELHEKDRVKAKSEVSLKKGTCKEVRFSGKIEQKDLKMKADTVKRLMERGYRVKCMALPVSKKEEEEDLGGYLSRILALIEDVAMVESGPHVERKQAYVVIRHVKFGPSKKGGVKKLKVVGNTSAVVRKASTSSPTIDPSDDISGPAICEEDPAEFGSENEDQTLDDEVDLPMSPPMEMQHRSKQNKTAWSASNSSDDNLNNIFDLCDDTKGATPKDKLPSPPPDSSHGAQNRYKRSEPRNQFPPTRPMDNRGPGMSDSVRSGPPQFSNQRRQPPPNMNVSPSMGETKQAGTDASAFRNTKLPNNMPKQEQSPNNMPKQEQPRPGFGIFSTPKANASGRRDAPLNFLRNEEGSPHTSARNPGSAGIGANQNIPGLKSDGSQPGIDNDGQKKWGIFSK